MLLYFELRRTQLNSFIKIRRLNMKNKFYLLITLLFLIRCSAIQTTLSDQEEYLKKLSADKFGTSFFISYNDTKSFALVVNQQKSTVKNPNPVLQFFVYDVGKSKISFEESVPAGKIKWKNNNQLEVVITPGTVSTEENGKLYGYIYNVSLGTKTDLNSLLIK
jgi:hypothetical protein